MNQFKKDTKKFNMYSDLSVKCKCGHSVVMYNFDKKLCGWCGKYVYKDKQTEFKYKLKNKMKGRLINE